VTKLIGATAGYTGYGDETEWDRVKQTPQRAGILFDEIEEADPKSFET